MDLFTAIKQRHSYRGAFTEAIIPREELITIVEAGLAAPSGKNAQTTQFIIIDDSGIRKKIATLPGGKKCLSTAPAMIACIVDKNPESIYENYNFQIEDCAAAVENMLLAITALGYASVWIDGWLRLQQRADQLAEWLNIPSDKVVRILLPLGIPAEKCTPPEKKAFAERVSFNAFNSSH